MARRTANAITFNSSCQQKTAEMAIKYGSEFLEKAFNIRKEQKAL